MPTAWLEEILAANETFVRRVDPAALPVARAPGTAVVTCMDPRVNLEAVGIPAFGEDGSGASTTRIIRTLGGRAEARSLLAAVYLAGVSETAVLMHTDCGCCLAEANIGVIAERLQGRLGGERLRAFKARLGSPFERGLLEYLQTFSDPYRAVAEEVATIRDLPFMPGDVVVHGLVYTLKTGRVEVVVDGSAV